MYSLKAAESVFACGFALETLHEVPEAALITDDTRCPNTHAFWTGIAERLI